MAITGLLPQVRLPPLLALQQLVPLRRVWAMFQARVSIATHKARMARPALCTPLWSSVPVRPRAPTSTQSTMRCLQLVVVVAAGLALTATYRRAAATRMTSWWCVPVQPGQRATRQASALRQQSPHLHHRSHEPRLIARARQLHRRGSWAAIRWVGVTPARMGPVDPSSPRISHELWIDRSGSRARPTLILGKDIFLLFAILFHIMGRGSSSSACHLPGLLFSQPTTNQ